VVHACNLSYSGGKRQEGCGSSPAQSKVSENKLGV
jgi:hypothetical protein